MAEQKGMDLSLNPNILRHIDRFDNLNNFEKEIEVSEPKPEELNALQKKRSRQDGGAIHRQ